MTRTRALVLGAVLALPILPACGSDSDSDSASSAMAGASGMNEATGGVTAATGGDVPGGSGGNPTGGTGGTGGNGGTAGELCGGVECSDGEECCGPPECGHCINAGTDPACPSSCPRRACGGEGLECLDPILGFVGELCVETQTLSAELLYKCEPNPCGSAEPLSCACAAAACADGTIPGPFCRDADPDALVLYCEEVAAVCASPDTPIATPEGEQPIASLAVGDLVYSAHNGALVPVPLVQVTRTPVWQHSVVRVRTADGVVLEISAGHPTADGRTFVELTEGDRLDGSPIVARALVPYEHPFTYDILPASSTGTYIAGGKLIGSTLYSLLKQCGAP